MNHLKISLLVFFSIAWILLVCTKVPENGDTTLARYREGFKNPPDTARPGVYWYFMDGNLSGEGITKDLESMKNAGIGNVVFLEVNVGIPRGKVDFLSDQWQDLFKHAVREAERLGIAITMGVGPGWTGSGGPWVSGSLSMKHLVSSSIRISGGETKRLILPLPKPMKPYFGEGNFTPELMKRWQDYYEDVAVLAFPTPDTSFKIQDIEEKALYVREPYTSKIGVKPFLPSLANYQEIPKESAVQKEDILDITGYLKPDGTMEWKVPEGNWTIMRFGSRNNGALTRPAPLPGLGFEADKFDTTAINAHLDHFIGKLLQKTGTPDQKLQGGLKMLHMDSWEMGAQNWTVRFREEFKKRRGYDPLPFYPVYAGMVVESLEKSERFLWDLHQTAQELVIENHAQYLKKYGQKYHLGFSIEPYDMNPTADMVLGAVADVPMCEFWSKGYGFNSSFSCIQAASIAHIEGKKVVAAEAFTAHKDAWKQYPGSMKNQGDWAFAAGVNRFVYHTFQHQFFSDSLKPGMTMGPYGVHWDRSQTWWPMATGYHKYIARCQYLLQQGLPVADILYLTPEGSPHVFRAPASAFSGDDVLPDREGHNFDGCSPSQLLKAKVENHYIVFPSGASYRLLVMPSTETMTPELLTKIESLVKAGASVVGNPPRKSPSLMNFPQCNQSVASMAKLIWGNLKSPNQRVERAYGKGTIYWGGELSGVRLPELYPNYDVTAALLQKLGVAEDFESSDSVRYAHHKTEFGEMYFVSNKTNRRITSSCTFRVSSGEPELWDPLTGETRALPEKTVQGNRLQLSLQFEPYQSYFIVFRRNENPAVLKNAETHNFRELNVLKTLDGPWEVSFDPQWGGPEHAVFQHLEDWSVNPVEGIKYYSGIATYHLTLNLEGEILQHNTKKIFLDLGEMHHMARVWVNGKEEGVLWTAPYRIEISEALVPGNNRIAIDVANLWPNRLIGDEQFPDDGITNGQWPEWLEKKQKRTSGRYTFTTAKFYKKDADLLKSGLIGPVRILIQ